MKEGDLFTKGCAGLWISLLPDKAVLPHRVGAGAEILDVKPPAGRECGHCFLDFA